MSSIALCCSPEGASCETACFMDHARDGLRTRRWTGAAGADIVASKSTGAGATEERRLVQRGRTLDRYERSSGPPPVHSPT
eukprot:6732449-Prymnesium_polylepis.1